MYIIRHRVPAPPGSAGRASIHEEHVDTVATLHDALRRITAKAIRDNIGFVYLAATGAEQPAIKFDNGEWVHVYRKPSSH